MGKGFEVEKEGERVLGGEDAGETGVD